MDKQTLINLIKEVAEVKELKPVTSPTMRLDDSHQNDVRVGDEWVHINKDANPTLGIKIVKLKPVHRLCELGCGDIVPNQLIEKRLCHTPETHWRTRCDTCGCFVSPDGQGFIEGGHQIQAAYMRYFRGERLLETKVTEDCEIKEYSPDRQRKWISDAEGKFKS
jgi:hypothetical protein